MMHNTRLNAGQPSEQLRQVDLDRHESVSRALAEDIGSGDVTAGLIQPDESMRAVVISRERAVICGVAWVDEVYRQLGAQVQLRWLVEDGQGVEPAQRLLELDGPARAILTGERCALNFMQTLSATATATRRFVDAVTGTGAVIVDTRKTIPGLRLAQKYAVTCGGGVNHRLGLHDGILIKENHIAAGGGITKAIEAARALNADVPLMAEAETLDELRAALAADVDLVLADDFTLDQLRIAVAWVRTHRKNGGHTLIEYSGGASLDNIRPIAETGVDRISVGAITKHVTAVDLSMRAIG